MKMFITARFKGDENRTEVEKLRRLVRGSGFEDFCFIRDIEKFQHGVFANPHELMKRAKEEFLQCDTPLIDVSDNPSGGRIIEAGIAFGHAKQVVVIAKHSIEIGTPILGIASHVIRYREIDDITDPLRSLAATGLKA